MRRGLKTEANFKPEVTFCVTRLPKTVRSRSCFAAIIDRYYSITSTRLGTPHVDTNETIGDS